MQASQRAIDLIKQFEGFCAKAYLCPANKLTIGYGHVIKPNEEELKTAALTEKQATNLMLQDLKPFEDYINNTCATYGIKLNHNQQSELQQISDGKAIVLSTNKVRQTNKTTATEAGRRQASPSQYAVLNQNQFDALTSFCFNVGCFKPAMLNRFKNKDLKAIGDSLALYNKAGGKVLAGLTARRKAEKELFFS